jgi:SPP1 gp7 family putative phage head morphogenesis protein
MNNLNIRTATKEPTKLIALRPPKSVELAIEQIILSVVKEANSLIFGAGEGPSHFLEIKRSLTQDGRIQIKDYTSPFDLFMDVFRMHLEAAVGAAQSKFAQVIANEEKRHRNRFAAAVKVRYGIDVESLLSGTETRKLIENQVRKSVALIRGLSDDMAKQVEFTILDAAQRRQSRTTLSERLRKTMQITRKRARLIAKDQTASFNGALNQARQTQIGIDRYIWETMQDERVRHEHAKRHGKTFYWSQPPEDGHPGEPINCRCTAIPLAVQLGR